MINEEEKPVEEQEETVEEQGEESKEEQPNEETSGDADAKFNELNEKYVRLYSEFDNYRKRTIKERSDLIKTATEDLMVALLPVLDDFDRAQQNMDEKADFQALKDGVDLMQGKLKQILTQQGLAEIESAIGEEMDIEKHEAVTRIPAPDKKLKGKIVDEVEKGYLLKEKVIRYTKVVVGE